MPPNFGYPTRLSAERLAPHLKATGAAPQSAGPGKNRFELFQRGPEPQRALLAAVLAEDKAGPSQLSLSQVTGFSRSGVIRHGPFPGHAAAGEAPGAGNPGAAAPVPGRGHRSPSLPPPRAR